MPVFRSRTVLEVARGVRAFLKLDIGLTRGEVPNLEQDIEQLRQKLERTRKQLAEKDRQLKRIQRSFSERNRQVVSGADAPEVTAVERPKDILRSEVAAVLDLIPVDFHGHSVPFVFTLYPGGGFQLDQDESDEKLRRVCSSPNFEKVIVTQKIIYEYLLDRKFCDPEKIEFIYGGVYPSSRLVGQKGVKNYYKRDKDTFDICFVAHKYMERGVDKGYDVFVEVAKLLSKTHEDIFFHVVGSFDETDIDVSGIRGRIKFYGTRPTKFFPAFYRRMDAILSPNVPFVLSPGAFDGFPTGACMEAGLGGVAVFCTDQLNQNVAFEDGEEIVIVPRDVETICATIDRYHQDPEALYELSTKGQKAFARVFDVEAQLEPRLRILSDLLERDSLLTGGDSKHNDPATGQVSAPSS